MKELFDNQEGHLTEFALRALAAGELEEMGRLETAEHLAFCDLCLERYLAVLNQQPLLQAPELLAPSVMRALRRKVVRVVAGRYFMAAVSACIALVFWVMGIFNVSSLRPVLEQEQQRKESSPFYISQAAGDLFSQWAGSLSDFLDEIDLKGVFQHEKE